MHALREEGTSEIISVRKAFCTVRHFDMSALKCTGLSHHGIILSTLITVVVYSREAASSFVHVPSPSRREI